MSVSSTEDDIQWYRIDVTSGTPVLADQGRVSAGKNTYLYYPGIDINPSGQIGMSYMRSGTDSSTDYMSMYVTGRSPSDVAGTMATPVLVQAGLANYHDYYQRAGDLSGINVDTDGSFWAANEFANTETNPNWGTAIAHFSLSSPTITISDVSQNEGDSGTTGLTFTISLSPASSQTVTVHWVTADGTATATDSDYVAASGDLTFKPGETSKTVTVQVIGDTRNEPDETFYVSLSSAAKAIISRGRGTGTIVNDDPAKSVQTVVTPNGMRLLLDIHSDLWWSPSLTAGWTRLDTAVASFAVAPNGDVISLEKGGNLFDIQLNGGPGVGHLIDTAVASFAPAPNGDVISLEKGGNLWDIQLNGGPGVGHLIDTAVASFAPAPNGDVISLEKGGNLWDIQLNGGPGVGHLVDTAVASFAAPNGDVISLEKGGNLWDIQLNGGPGVGHLIDTAVASFAPAPNGDVISLEKGGNLWDIQLNGGPGVGHLVDTAVASFAGAQRRRDLAGEGRQPLGHPAQRRPRRRPSARRRRGRLLRRGAQR